MTAQDRMSRGVRSVPRDSSVWSALAIMRQEGIRHLLVKEGERLVGVLSNRDYRKILEQAGPDGSVHRIRAFTVAQIMTAQEQLVTARAETPILDVAKLIVARNVGCIPVLDARNQPIGILTQKDVMAALVDLLTHRRSA